MSHYPGTLHLPYLDFSRVRHLHQGGREILFFDKKARVRLARANPGAARETERLTRTYAIVGSQRRGYHRRPPLLRGREQIFGGQHGLGRGGERVGAAARGKPL